ncbi:MAG: glycoside hydrolase family 88 protein [Burkholderiales bacterium]|nr:glycoside hydrolase family 88 protein [Anaerolineae bacterium]
MLDVERAAKIRAVAEQTIAYPFKVWGFGEGLALEALWLVGDLLPEPRYRAFVIDLFEQWLQREIVEADHSAPGGLLLEVYESTGDERYLARAQALAEHMCGLPTAPFGARLHRPQHPDYHDYLYVDCMEVDAPFLCKLAQVTGDSALFDDAALQILAYSRLLQDKRTCLFYHQYNATTKIVNGAFWGRGNAWALLGLLKTLQLLPESHSAYTELRQRLNGLAAALQRSQLFSGDWPTVLDQPDTYAEGSLAAMFTYGLASASASLLLDENYSVTIAQGLMAMNAHLSAAGLLLNTSIATPPGDAAHYNRIATTSGLPWGQGPGLLALCTLR